MFCVKIIIESKGFCLMHKFACYKELTRAKFHRYAVIKDEY